MYHFSRVCLSVCQAITFGSLDIKKFIFAHPVYLQERRISFVYEDLRVKVKVTGAKKVENPYSCNVIL